MGDTPKATIAPIAPQIDFVLPADVTKDFGVGDAEPSAAETRIGLWDNCWNLATNKFVNDVNEKDNFVGSDGRRFYIRVRDPGAKGKGFVEVDWWTAYSNSVDKKPGIVHDGPKSPLHLLETGASTGVFTSRALMIVSDKDDRDVQVNSGIPSSHPTLGKHSGDRFDNVSNYRLRRGSMFGHVVASYTPKGAKTPTTAIVPIFLKKSRKLLPLQVYVLRQSAGGDPSVPMDEVFDIDLTTITEIYTRVGIWPWTTVSPADQANAAIDKVKGTAGYTVCLVDPPSGVNPAAVNEPAIDVLGTSFPAAAPNTIRLFFVGGLAATKPIFGISFGITPDPSAPPAEQAKLQSPPARVGVTVVQANRGDRYTAAHELGHLISNKSKVLADTTFVPPVFFEINHYRSPGGRLPSNFNLMYGPGPFKPGTLGPLQPKRIWGGSDKDGHDQLFNVELSRFLR